MATVEQVCDAVGRAELARLLGVRKQAVSNAVADGRFPAKWFSVVRDLCASRGIDCPESLFSFAQPVAATPVADGDASERAA
jgi:hypothetical protein